MTPYDICAQQLSGLKQQAILDFWHAFAAHADALDAHFMQKTEAPDVDLLSILAPLREVDENLMWEFGPSDKGHQLCITSEWRSDLRHIAHAVIAAAPDLARWNFTDARAPCDAELAIPAFEARRQTTLCLTAIQLEAGDSKVDAFVEGTADTDTLIQQTEGILSILLGEAKERDWLGQISAKTVQSKGLFKRQKSAPTMDANALSQCATAFDTQINTIRTTLPDTPFAAQDIDTRQAMLLDITHAQADNGRADIFSLTAPHTTYATAALNPSLFCSANHSKHGEHFAFLRITRTPECPFDDVIDRAAVEDNLHAALQSANAGGLVAAGHGTDAVYIDVAIADLATALPIIADTCKSAPWADGATLHFLDAGLVDIALPLAPFTKRVFSYANQFHA